MSPTAVEQLPPLKLRRGQVLAKVRIRVPRSVTYTYRAPVCVFTFSLTRCCPAGNNVSDASDTALPTTVMNPAGTALPNQYCNARDRRLSACAVLIADAGAPDLRRQTLTVEDVLVKNGGESIDLRSSRGTDA
jgi:hypothetical protein